MGSIKCAVRSPIWALSVLPGWKACLFPVFLISGPWSGEQGWQFIGLWACQSSRLCNDKSGAQEGGQALQHYRKESGFPRLLEEERNRGSAGVRKLPWSSWSPFLVLLCVAALVQKTLHMHRSFARLEVPEPALLKVFLELALSPTQVSQPVTQVHFDIFLSSPTSPPTLCQDLLSSLCLLIPLHP